MALSRVYLVLDEGVTFEEVGLAAAHFEDKIFVIPFGEGADIARVIRIGEDMGRGLKTPENHIIEHVAVGYLGFDGGLLFCEWINQHKIHI